VREEAEDLDLGTVRVVKAGVAEKADAGFVEGED